MSLAISGVNNILLDIGLYSKWPSRSRCCGTSWIKLIDFRPIIPLFPINIIQKYAHGLHFAVMYCGKVIIDFTNIPSCYFTGTGAIVRLPTGEYAQIAKFMWPTWGPPGSCRLQMAPMNLIIRVEKCIHESTRTTITQP